MTLNTTIFAIIVTYNGSRWIDECLSTLSTSSLPLHTIVIDNASTDKTVELINEKFPDVVLIPLDKNLGFGAANNIGLKRALEQKADYVFLLNQDAWVEGNTIEELIQVAQNHPKYGILSPYHFNYEGSATERYFGEWVLKHYTPQYCADMKTGNIKQVYTTSFVHAACWLLPICTVKEVGGFDPLFFHYDEDVDFVNRVRTKNRLVGIIPTVRVYHNGTNQALADKTSNLNLNINQSVLQLKNLNATFVGAIVLFFKQFFRVILSQTTNTIQKRAYCKNLMRLPAILKSRKTQRKNLAYLR